MTTTPIRLGGLISGGGTTLLNLLDHIDADTLNAVVGCVICSNPNAAGIDRIRQRGLSVEVIRRKAFATAAEYSQAIFARLRAARVELACLAGFLQKIEIPTDYENRVINVHPALLPAFGGKGMYGHHVHQAVLAHGCKVSGCTVHFADNAYDNGPIIAQRCVPVEADDTAESLAARVMEAEREVYPTVVQAIAEGRVSVDGRRVVIL